MIFQCYLPASFDTVEILPKGAPQDPQLGQAELVRLLDLGIPDIDRRLRAVVLLALNVRYRVLKIHSRQLQIQCTQWDFGGISSSLLQLTELNTKTDGCNVVHVLDGRLR
jgi:hypothetical protein